jgi:hypothetical protein
MLCLAWNYFVSQLYTVFVKTICLITYFKNHLIEQISIFVDVSRTFKSNWKKKHLATRKYLTTIYNKIKNWRKKCCNNTLFFFVIWHMYNDVCFIMLKVLDRSCRIVDVLYFKTYMCSIWSLLSHLLW